MTRMGRLKKTGKLILMDTVGVLLIIISPLIGWLPGPGGIPLFLAGLGLLAVHHDWAKRWQTRIKKEGARFIKTLFSDHPLLRAIYDFLSAVLIFIGIYLINTYTKNITLTFAIFCVLLGIGLFLGNRERLQSITKWLRR